MLGNVQMLVILVAWGSENWIGWSFRSEEQLWILTALGGGECWCFWIGAFRPVSFISAFDSDLNDTYGAFHVGNRD